MEVIRESASLHELGKPVLIPIPRKAEDHRVMAYITLALEYGADFIRVHDVEEATDLVTLFGRTAPGCRHEEHPSCVRAQQCRSG